ncbi:MAG: hypothetical protein MI748_11610, partial [Opitutales bacterium]|nr:hypothetical protein [Opitutales bacterium]
EVIKLPVEIDTGDHTLICDSDAHYLEDIGRRTFSFARAPEETVLAALTRALAEGAVELSIAHA